MEPAKTTTIATQIGKETNKGLGRTTLRPEPSNSIYP